LPVCFNIGHAVNPLIALQPELAPELERGMAMLGLSMPGLASRLLDYLALLNQWNHAYNLTAVRDPQQMLSRHLLDSLSILPWLPAGPLADLGSGAGLPGIVLALARPELAVTVVESNGKKARFLREVVRQLGLANVRVAQSRAEQLDEPGAYGCITARALGTLAQLVQFGGDLLQPGGQLLAMKGQYPADEIAALPAPWQVQASHVLAIPGDSAARHLIVVTRASAPCQGSHP
jgi:16S rRNA (guanine527-N7)-methyltransferase